MIADKSLTCHDCGAIFLFTVDEQAFFSAKGLTNLPKRCPNCRLVSRMRRNGADVANVYTTSCADCGAPTVVPFQPKGHKPIYCNHCFKARKTTEVAESVAI